MPKMESEEPGPEIHPSHRQAWAEGYDESFSSGLVCRRCGAVVSKNSLPGGRSYRDVHTAWHEANDGR